MTDETKYHVKLSDGRQFGPANMAMLIKWAKEGRIPQDAMLVPDDGREPFAAVEEAAIKIHILAPPTVASGIVPNKDEEGPALVPYKNPAALVGYYIGVCSCIPFIGILLGPAAIILGIKGLLTVKKHPLKKGTAHAWMSISFGIVGIVVSILVSLVLLPVMLGP